MQLKIYDEDDDYHVDTIKLCDYDLDDEHSVAEMIQLLQDIIDDYTMNNNT